MKKIILAMLLSSIIILAKDIVVFQNEFKVLQLNRGISKIIIGSKGIINVSLLNMPHSSFTTLKLYGKKSGNTSMLIVFSNGKILNYQIYVNQNLAFIQSMINNIQPKIRLHRIGDGSIIISGVFSNPHEKKRVYKLLANAGFNLKRIMDITTTTKINKMVRTKLYLVQINNTKAKQLGGITGLGFFNQYISASLNPGVATSATFSGWLLNNIDQFSTFGGSGTHSLTSTLKFLQTKGIAKILDDTVLTTTEDKNASFQVGGDVYIPIGLTQTGAGYPPTIQLRKKQYGLKLVLTTKFLNHSNYIDVDVKIGDSEFDPDKAHDVSLGSGVVVPSFLSKHISTNIVAKSGQVIALGGRLHKQSTVKKSKIPFLGDLPLIGRLFRNDSTSNNENDLLFFLVPQIINQKTDTNDTHFYHRFEQGSQKLNLLGSDDNTTTVKTLDIQNEHKTSSKKIDTIVLTPKKGTIGNAAIVNNISVKDINFSDNNITTSKNSQIIMQPKKSIQVVKQHVVIKQKSVKLMQHDCMVSTKKIFIRSKPINGTIQGIWIYGHKFITTLKQQTKTGGVWINITQDCYKNVCRKLSHVLWISRRFTYCKN